MKEEKKKRWEEIITTINITHSSRNAWKTIIHISNHPASSTTPCLVNINQVAHHLLISSKGTMSSKPKRHALPPTTEIGKSMLYPFSEEEYRRDIAALRNLCPKTHKWLLAMLNNCFTQNKIPFLAHVQTIRTLDPEQNGAYHSRTPHQRTGRLSTRKVMYRSTVESNSTH